MRTDTTKNIKPLGRIIGAFKTVSTKKINILNNTPGKQFWQRSFYDRIVRNEKEYFRILENISNNPMYWSWDKENPEKLTIFNDQ